MDKIIVIEIPVAGIVLFGIVTAFLLAGLAYRIRRKKEVPVLKPFSEPMPGPKPVPPYMAPPMPVIPMADRNIKPVHVSYRSAKYERTYSPVTGTVECLNCRKGQKVTKGETVLTIKIGDVISEIKASCSGIVRELNKREGSKVRIDDLLFVIM